MSGITIFLGNELMALLTIAIVFPGMFPPEDGVELFAGVMFLVCISVVWPIFLALAPFVFFALWMFGDWKPSDHFDEWPWKYFKRS